MSTRAERYKDKAVKSSRSSRNKKLYNTVYSNDKYSNIEGVASIDNGDKIDISKVKEMLDSREHRKVQREYRVADKDKKTEELPVVRKRFEEDTEKNYDIMDVLKEAKEKKEPDNKERVLNNTNYDVLKKLKLDSKANVEPSIEETKKEDLKDLIETISNTSMLNKVDDEDLALDMFKDLTDDDDTKVGDIKDINELIDKNEKTMDDSFFTGKIKRADFVSGEKKSHPFKTFLLFVFILAIIAGAVILVLYNFGMIK